MPADAAAGRQSCGYRDFPESIISGSGRMIVPVDIHRGENGITKNRLQPGYSIVNLCSTSTFPEPPIVSGLPHRIKMAGSFTRGIDTGN
jgi:hypothetical protein